MTWAHRRQLTVVLIIMFFLTAIAAYPVYKIFFEVVPSCFDNKKNGTESGIDCGGSCTKVCKAGAADVVVHWRRVFQVVPGVYSVAAEVENINATYAAFEVPYTFSLLDRDKVEIAYRKGTAYIAPHTTSIIFEGNLQTGTREPQSVNFEIVTNPQWYENGAADKPLPRISNEVLENGNPTTGVNVDGKTVAQPLPKYSVRLSNDTFDQMTNLEAVAVLYDKNGNAVGVSKTVVDTINGQSSRDIVFTWRMPFTAPVVNKGVILTYVPTQRERESIMLNPVTQAVGQ